MTSRQQRKAAERKARKQKSRNGNTAPCRVLPLPSPSVSSSQASWTQAQNDYSALVAAASPALLFPGENADHYRSHLQHFFQQHQPQPGVESVLVQRLADYQWRLQRIAALEAGIMALGRRKYAELFPEAATELRSSLTDAHTIVAEVITLKRLQSQESHLRRYYAKDLAELKEFQDARLRKEDGHRNTDEHSPLSEPAASMPAPILVDDENGFEFSFDNDAGLPGHPASPDFLDDLLGSDLSPDLSR